ncbi:MAG: alpha/beta hydrolase [Legionella sp.]
MLPIEKLVTAGEHPFIFNGNVGALEAVLSVPDSSPKMMFAIIGHPHSQQGGTMNNKVVTTLVKVFKELNIPSIRFNFRGVGQSEGIYDHGIGESEDMLSLVKEIQTKTAINHFIFAGFSFGSYVAYRVAAQHPHQLLLTVAPAVTHYDYQEFDSVPSPWIVAQGDIDDVVPEIKVLDFVASIQKPMTLLRFQQTGHFFHGRLTELKSRLIDSIRDQVKLICN